MPIESKALGDLVIAAIDVLVKIRSIVELVGGCAAEMGENK